MLGQPILAFSNHRRHVRRDCSFHLIWSTALLCNTIRSYRRLLGSKLQRCPWGRHDHRSSSSCCSHRPNVSEHYTCWMLTQLRSSCIWRSMVLGIWRIWGTRKRQLFTAAYAGASYQYQHSDSDFSGWVSFLQRRFLVCCAYLRSRFLLGIEQIWTDWNPDRSIRVHSNNCSRVLSISPIAVGYHCAVSRPNLFLHHRQPHHDCRRHARL